MYFLLSVLRCQYHGTMVESFQKITCTAVQVIFWKDATPK